MESYKEGRDSSNAPLEMEKKILLEVQKHIQEQPEMSPEMRAELIPMQSLRGAKDLEERFAQFFYEEQSTIGSAIHQEFSQDTINEEVLLKYICKYHIQPKLFKEKIFTNPDSYEQFCKNMLPSLINTVATHLLERSKTITFLPKRFSFSPIRPYQFQFYKGHRSTLHGKTLDYLREVKACYSLRHYLNKSTFYKEVFRNAADQPEEQTLFGTLTCTLFLGLQDLFIKHSKVVGRTDQQKQTALDELRQNFTYHVLSAMKQKQLSMHTTYTIATKADCMATVGEVMNKLFDYKDPTTLLCPYLPKVELQQEMIDSWELIAAKVKSERKIASLLQEHFLNDKVGGYRRRVRTPIEIRSKKYKTIEDNPTPVDTLFYIYLGIQERFTKGVLLYKRALETESEQRKQQLMDEARFYVELAKAHAEHADKHLTAAETFIKIGNVLEDSSMVGHVDSMKKEDSALGQVDFNDLYKELISTHGLDPDDETVLKTMFHIMKSHGVKERIEKTVKEKNSTAKKEDNGDISQKKNETFTR